MATWNLKNHISFWVSSTLWIQFIIIFSYHLTTLWLTRSDCFVRKKDMCDLSQWIQWRRESQWLTQKSWGRGLFINLWCIHRIFKGEKAFSSVFFLLTFTLSSRGKAFVRLFGIKCYMHYTLSCIWFTIFDSTTRPVARPKTGAAPKFAKGVKLTGANDIIFLIFSCQKV